MEAARGGKLLKDYEKVGNIYARRLAERNKNSSATIGHHATINRI